MTIKTSDIFEIFKNKKKNIYSQTGEDGVILELLNLFSKKYNIFKQVCEFGAYDGKYCSNTFNLIKNLSFYGVLIEGDENKFKKLKKLKEKFNVDVFNYFITEKNLDEILHKTKLERNFDILSIDIDSYDLNVWKNLIDFRPKLLIIEIDNSIGAEEIVEGTINNDGSSFAYALEIAKIKKYTLIGDTGNLFFIDNYFALKIGLNLNDFKDSHALFNSNWTKETYIKKFIKKILTKNIILHSYYLRFIKKFWLVKFKTHIDFGPYGFIDKISLH